MEKLEELIANENHEEIAKLEDPELNEYKVIALIKLGEFKEAKNFCKKNSYEMAYIYYRLKNYKKCLKTLRKFDDNSEKVRVLKSQAFYYQQRYNQAYDMLESVSCEDEFAVNLEAMKSFAILAQRFSVKTPSKYSVCKKDEFANFKEIKNLKGSEIQEEFAYNETFKYLHNEEMYLDKLTDAAKKYKGGLIANQLANVGGDFFNVVEDGLKKFDMEILQNNRGLISGFTNYYHYMKNLKPITNEEYWPECEYACYKKAKEMNFEGIDAKIGGGTEVLRMLKAFIELKRKFKGEKFNGKFLKKRFDGLIWNLIEILNLKKEDFNEKKGEILKLLKVSLD